MNDLDNAPVLGRGGGPNPQALRRHHHSNVLLLTNHYEFRSDCKMERHDNSRITDLTTHSINTVIYILVWKKRTETIGFYTGIRVKT